MIIKIDEPGHYVKFPKLKSFRTPCKVQISEKDLNKVLIELRRLGIQNYVIISGDYSREPKSIIKEQILNEDINKLEDRFDILEDLLKQSLNRSSQTIIKQEKFEESEKSNKDVIIEELDNFIPSIDLEGMKIKGSSFKTQKVDSNLKETSNLLSKLIKKSNKSK